jgi:hypothetical protein
MKIDTHRASIMGKQLGEPRLKGTKGSSVTTDLMQDPALHSGLGSYTTGIVTSSQYQVSQTRKQQIIQARLLLSLWSQVHDG